MARLILSAATMVAQVWSYEILVTVNMAVVMVIRVVGSVVTALVVGDGLVAGGLVVAGGGLVVVGGLVVAGGGLVVVGGLVVAGGGLVVAGGLVGVGAAAWPMMLTQ